TRDDPARTLVVVDDVLQDLPYLEEIGRRRLQEAQAGLRVGENPGQRLVQLVSQGGSQFAHRRAPREVRQFLAAPLRFELGTLALGDVGMRDNGTTVQHAQRYH